MDPPFSAASASAASASSASSSDASRCRPKLNLSNNLLLKSIRPSPTKPGPSPTKATAQELRRLMEALSARVDAKDFYDSQVDNSIANMLEILGKLETSVESIAEENSQLWAYVRSLCDILAIPEHFDNVVPDLYSNVYDFRLQTWEIKNELERIWKCIADLETKFQVDEAPPAIPTSASTDISILTYQHRSNLSNVYRPFTEDINF